MITARIDFGPCPSDLSKDQWEDLVQGYLACLLHNWQIIHDLYPSWQNGRLHSYASLSRRDALNIDYHSEWGKQELRKLSELAAFDAVPPVEILSDEYADESTESDSADSLVLYTTAMDRHSPLRSLPDWLPLALYTLPINDSIRQDVYSWAADYRHMDSIWISSGDLNVAAYQQLCEPSSELTASGRELCTRIEAATNKPTYYYLHKYYGRLNDDDSPEEGRLCPGCGQDWENDSPSSDSDDAFGFAFKCDECRLVSQHESDFDDEDLASYGEWRDT